MATTQSEDTAQTGAPADRPRRFVSAGTDAAVEAQANEEITAKTQRRRAVIITAAIGTVALICFVMAAGFAGGQGTVSEATQAEVFELRDGIQLAEAKTEALPDAAHADRGLISALASADQVAQLQNDYRHLTPMVAADSGSLDPDAAMSTRRNLIPYFAQTEDPAVFTPWHLLAADADVPLGVGIPMSFESGFEWKAQVPSAINDDGTISVVWLALQKYTPEGVQPAVLAWARADYDITRKTFANVKVGTTTIGDDLGQEVMS
jgi:hypothetical protein